MKKIISYDIQYGGGNIIIHVKLYSNPLTWIRVPDMKADQGAVVIPMLLSNKSYMDDNFTFHIREEQIRNLEFISENQNPPA